MPPSGSGGYRYAWKYRKTVMGEDTDCCRLIFGEADSFPGLTVDRFHDLLVTQTLSLGMERLKPVIFPLLYKVLTEDGQTIRGIYERNDVALRAHEGLEENKGWYLLGGSCRPGEPPDRHRGERGGVCRRCGERAENGLFPGSEV